MNNATKREKIRLGISSCLLGEKVRFDGGHKKNDFILNTLSEFFEWVPVCPEVEIGLSTPRESIRLVGRAESPRFVTTKTETDLTDRMLGYASRRVAELKKLNLHGYLLKKDSPSCGMERVRVYHPSGSPSRNGVGIFARELTAGIPYLPVEEEGRLSDMKLRENFIVRVFSYHRWLKLVERKFQTRNLIQFHAQHKYLLMAHSEKHLRDLGKLVAGTKDQSPARLLRNYGETFFEALRRKSTRAKHTNVLQHIFGYFKKKMQPDEKNELLQIIEDYRQGLLPLIVPVTLLKHYVNKFEIQYIQNQIYLNPHPKELMLLNHV